MRNNTLIIPDATPARLEHLAQKHNAVAGKILDWELSLAETQAVIDDGTPNPFRDTDTPSPD